MVRALLTALLLILVPSAAHPQGAPQGAWAKWCYESTVPGRNKDNKQDRTAVNVCATYRRHTDPVTGMLLSITLWQVQDQKNGTDMGSYLQVTVPLGSQLKTGMRLGWFSKSAWENAKNEWKFAEDEFRAKLKYSRCSPDGCTEALRVTPAFVAILKESGGLVVQGTSVWRGQVTFRVPLAGFAEALADERPLPRRLPHYDRPTRCDAVVDDTGPCSAKSLLKGWRQ